jgi:hypothetical protein
VNESRIGKPSKRPAQRGWLGITLGSGRVETGEMSNRRWVGIYVAVLAVVVAWLFRIDAQPLGDLGAVVTNRWLGTVHVCYQTSDCRRLYP